MASTLPHFRDFGKSGQNCIRNAISQLAVKSPRSSVGKFPLVFPVDFFGIGTSLRLSKARGYGMFV